MTKKNFILPGLILATVLVLTFFGITDRIWQEPPSYRPEPGFKIVSDAYANRQSGIVAEVEGEVTRLMLDSRKSPQNQSFVIETITGQALVVFHDLGDSEKIPVAVGDKVNVRGEYRWSEPGGSLIWTNGGSGPGSRNGWIEHKGKLYD